MQKDNPDLGRVDIFLKDIGHRQCLPANEAARVAAGAVTEAGATIQKLGLSSKEIVDVVMVITSIAEQTSLLALNACTRPGRW